jgi:Mechanosensitive ion channel
VIGTASAKYFEGLLFILVRRPYGIGDCIHISDPNTESSYSGSPFWFVEDISLFSTQVRFSFTNERASLSNGSLANSRIINSSKSSNAGVYHLLKFPLDVPYEKVKVFHEALEAFVRNRPREWIGLSSFRAVSVNAQSGYIEYIICLDHRESWASWGQVRTSQSDLMGFGVELAKKLDIVYKQPTLPIDLNLNQREKEDLVNHMTPGNFPPLPLTVYHPQDIQGGAGDFDRPALPMDFQHLADKFPPRPPISKTD